MRGTYRRWDPAEYIGNEEEARLYLEACTEDAVMRVTRALGMDLRITTSADPLEEQQAVTPAPSPHRR